jgi:hypothetical protein
MRILKDTYDNRSIKLAFLKAYWPIQKLVMIFTYPFILIVLGLVLLQNIYHSLKYFINLMRDDIQSLFNYYLSDQISLYEYVIAGIIFFNQQKCADYLFGKFEDKDEDE